MMVRSPDAVMGVGFMVVFPLTFLSNAFVPIDTLPDVLQWVAAWNPVSVMVAAVRELFGNPLVAGGQGHAGRWTIRWLRRSCTAGSSWPLPSLVRCGAIRRVPPADTTQRRISSIHRDDGSVVEVLRSST